MRIECGREVTALDLETVLGSLPTATGELAHRQRPGRVQGLRPCCATVQIERRQGDAMVTETLVE